MAESSAISWTDSTQNFWLGCTKVSPACDFCYAETWAIRTGQGDLWQGRRQRTKTWNEPRRWQAGAATFLRENGHRRRVFTNSLADFFDNEVPDAWREDAWRVIAGCPDLDWYIVTKRISNVPKMLPSWKLPASVFNAGMFGHIVIIITVVTQAEANRDIPRLIELKAKYPWLKIGLSVEPMLEQIFLRAEWLRMLDWVICGGESGKNPRMLPPLAVIYLKDACRDFNIPFHFKQIGHNHIGWGPGITGKGDNPEEWPEELRVQEFPRMAA